MYAALVAQKSDTKLGRPSIQITPFRVISVLDRTIYQFVKFGGKDIGARRAFEDPKVPRQMATICIIRGAKTFQLCFYPWQDRPQIVEDLPIEDLPKAVADLLVAGFGEEKDLQGVADKKGAPVLTENKRVQLLSP